MTGKALVVKSGRSHSARHQTVSVNVSRGRVLVSGAGLSSPTVAVVSVIRRFLVIEAGRRTFYVNIKGVGQYHDESLFGQLMDMALSARSIACDDFRARMVA